MSRKKSINILCVVFALVFSFGASVFAENSSTAYYSHFQYELGPGEGADDAVVLVNEEPEGRMVELVVSDDVLETSLGEHVPVDIATEDVTASVRNWVRFYPAERVFGSQDIETVLGGTYPSRIFPLCQALRFGFFPKEERERLVVRALNRTLSTPEIVWLAETTVWCEGVVAPKILVGPQESVRVPFIIVIPSEINPSSFQGVVLGRTERASDIAATISVKMPGTPPAAISVYESRLTYRESTQRYEVRLVTKNEGGVPVLVTPDLLVERLLPVFHSSHVPFDDYELQVGESREAVWAISKPFWGRFKLSPQISFSEVGRTKVQLVSGIESFEFTAYPPVFVFIIIACLVIFVGAMVMSRKYWQRRWLNIVRKSWIPYNQNNDISLTELASELGISVRTLAKINHIDEADMIRRSDSILIPSSIILGKQISNTNKTITKRMIQRK